MLFLIFVFSYYFILNFYQGARRASIQREPSEIRQNRAYDSSFSIRGLISLIFLEFKNNFLGSDTSLANARQTITSGLTRIESGMNSFENRRTDARRMARASAGAMDSVNRSLNSSYSRFTTLQTETGSRFSSANLPSASSAISRGLGTSNYSSSSRSSFSTSK